MRVEIGGSFEACGVLRFTYTPYGDYTGSASRAYFYYIDEHKHWRSVEVLLCVLVDGMFGYFDIMGHCEGVDWAKR